MKTGSHFSVFRAVRYTVGYFSFLVLVVMVFHSKISHDQQAIRMNKGLGIQLQVFSPAYAAFEDEYLFDEFDQIKSERVLAGVSDSYFISQQEAPSLELMSVTPLAFQITLPPVVEDIEEPSQVAKETSPSKKRLHKGSSSRSNPTIQAAAENKNNPDIAISIGPIVAFKGPQKKNPVFAAPTTRAQQKNSSPKSEVDQLAQTSIQKISGRLELTGGIAFLGDLEVSWVVEDEELGQGQIWVKEGYYEVPIEYLTGDIIISLYDEDGKLAGEGIANLDQLSSQEGFDPEHVDIKIKAIDTSLAGKVYNGEYIHTNKPVEKAEIILFGMNETARTDSVGQYHFPDWRNSGSRTIAMASKSGYKDSVYIIDSSQTHEVFLFPNDYINALYKQLIQMGYDSDIQEFGLVYGRIQQHGQALSGVDVSIDGQKTAYFAPYYIPQSQQKFTSGNGLFTIAGLDNGEHELLVEKNGKVIDRRIVVVEAGKVSPLIIDIDLKSKQVKFFDPFQPQGPIEQTGYRFFDGEEYLLAKKDGRVNTTTTSGKDPALLEFAQNVGDENNIFINRTKRFEQVPVINTTWFQNIKNEFKLNIEDGIAVGFIKSKEHFVVSVAESPPDEILYFDQEGSIIRPSDNTLPSGFILVGLEQGLHTLICESQSGSEVFFTDMIYNNHQSISVLYKDLR